MSRGRTVIIVERIPLLAQGLELLLADLGADVLCRHSVLEGGLKSLDKLKPQLLVASRDSIGGDLVAAIEAIRELSPKTRTVLLWTRLDRLDLRRCRRAGVTDYLPLTDNVTELRRAFRCLLSTYARRGECGGGAGAEAPASGSGAEPIDVLAELTIRERDVLPHLARGLTVIETSEILCLSPKTVDAHRSRIMAKLGIHDRVTLARFAIREGLIPVWDEAV